MTTSKCFVWTWLPGHDEPVVAGVLEEQEKAHYISSFRLPSWTHRFRYAVGYLDREDSIALGPDLPLHAEWQVTEDGSVHGSIEDGLPDAWGKRVLMYHHSGDELQKDDPEDKLSPVYLGLNSDSDRIGAIDFQADRYRYCHRGGPAILQDLQHAAETAEEGEVPQSLREALWHGTSVGGARPKATLVDDEGSWIAKFESRTDVVPDTRWEMAATHLAARTDIEVPEARLMRVRGKDILLLRRFDREGKARRHLVTARTFAGAAGLQVSYPGIADALRISGSDDVAGDVFNRAAFNVAISNDDDHHLNHAAFWDGQRLTLTPAFDLTPQITGSSMQAIALNRAGSHRSSLKVLIDAAADFGLSKREARERVGHVVHTVETGFAEAADLARLSRQEAEVLRQRILTARSTEDVPRTA